MTLKLYDPPCQRRQEERHFSTYSQSRDLIPQPFIEQDVCEVHKSQSDSSFTLQVIFAEFRHWLAGSLSKRQQSRFREQWSVWVREQTEQCMVQGSHQWVCVCFRVVLSKTDSSCGIFWQIPNSLKWITTLLQWSKVYPHLYLPWRTRTAKSRKNVDSRPWTFVLPSFWTGSRYADDTW